MCVRAGTPRCYNNSFKGKRGCASSDKRRNHEIISGATTVTSSSSEVAINMSFLDELCKPQALLQMAAGTLEGISAAASTNKGIVAFYFQTPIKYWLKNSGTHGWKQVWQLMDFNVLTDEVDKLYKYKNSKKVDGVSVRPDPNLAAVAGRELFFGDELPKHMVKVLQDAAYYYRTGAKKDEAK